MKITLEKNSGITLIALVVTIIVLLILASVSITVILGDNGLIEMAKSAADKTNQAVKNDQGDIANITGQLENILNGENVPVFDEAAKKNIKIGKATRVNDYGKKVREYTVTTEEFTSGVWRLFYQDENYTYLITDELVGNYTLQEEYENGNYENGSKVSIIGQNLNPMLKNQKTTCEGEECGFFDVGNTNENIRGVAWLTDTGNWSDYAKGDAIYAIGSPTIELFAASFNAVQSNEKIKLEPGENGYKVLDFYVGIFSDFGGIYNKDNSGFWWLPSPMDYSYDYLFRIVR